MDFLNNDCPCEINECCPSNPQDVLFYTEVIVDGELKIPNIKPCIEKIVDVSRKVCLKKIVPIPVRLNNGCIVGYKLLVSGIIKLGIEYSAAVIEQEVHFAHFDIPFQGIITENACQEPLHLTECELKRLKLNVCVEHLQVHQIDHRNIKKVIVLLIWLEDERCHVTPDPCECPSHHQHPHHHKGNHSIKQYHKKHKHPPSYDHPDCYKHKHEYSCECDEDNNDIPCFEVHDDCIPDISKEISVNHTLIIPCQKPPMECVLNSDINIKITKAEVINTPIVTSCHEHVRKVVVTGNAEIIVKYVADVPDQQVHVAVFTLPFKALIEWPGGPPKNSPIKVCDIVEHFQVEMLDKRRLFAVLVLRLDVFEER